MRRDFAFPLLVVGALAFAAFANNSQLYLITLAALTVVVGVGLNVLIGLSFALPAFLYVRERRLAKT